MNHSIKSEVELKSDVWAELMWSRVEDRSKITLSLVSEQATGRRCLFGCAFDWAAAKELYL